MLWERARANELYSYSTVAPAPNASRKEIGEEAIWTLSSAKPGNGVDQLRDDNTATFWQSDGAQPHTVSIQFMRKTRIKELALYLDLKSDESYTPNKLSIRAGSCMQDLKEVLYVELKDPVGWFIFTLKGKLLDGTEQPFIAAMNLQLAVLQNQHSGKDTHIRQVKVFGPRDKHSLGLGFPDFKNPEITKYYALR
jgi:anaphase-promoting complex subunit 10